MNFDDAFEKLIGHEGGLSMTPNDRGNWTGGRRDIGLLNGTKFGISAASYPSLDIENITLAKAKAIYRADYWGPAGCDSVPDPIKYPLFDLAVNSGPGRAAKFLQKAVGEIEDGAIGPRTLLALGTLHPQLVLRRMDAHRLLLMASDPAWPAFGRGWVIRVATNAL